MFSGPASRPPGPWQNESILLCVVYVVKVEPSELTRDLALYCKVICYIAAGHDGASLSGKVMSFMTFRDRGIVVAVMSNIAYADTFVLALNVAEAFAEQSAPTRIQ